MARPRGIPRHRIHKPSGRSFVEINGKRHYTGKAGSQSARQKYSRLIAEYVAQGGRPPAAPPRNTTVEKLVHAFHFAVVVKYEKNGKPTSERRSYQTALRPVLKLYGKTLAKDFGPLALTACRQKLIDAGYCRRRINSHVGRIRRVWKWGASREIVPVETWQALTTLEGLRKGEAPDRPKVKPVALKDVLAIRRFVSPQIWTMIVFQLRTGCRPGEACIVRTIDINAFRDVWEYRPESHKVEHHDIDRVIAIGPRLQRTLRRWLRDDPYAYLFQPCESKEWHYQQRRKNAKSPRYERQMKRRGKPKKQPGVMYKENTYRSAISQACKKAGVPNWHPNQLRHTVLTDIRERFDLEAARAVGGHTSTSTTEIYAERDLKRAREVMRNLG